MVSKNCVYLIHYNEWNDCKWKIGSSKNLDARMKQYKTHNSSIPDIIFVKYIESHSEEETNYHKIYKNKRIINTREYFELNKDDIYNLKLDGFEIYNGEYNNIYTTIEEKCNNLLIDMDKQLSEIRNEYKNKIDNIKIKYNKLIEKNKEFIIKQQKDKDELIIKQQKDNDDLIIKQQKDKDDLIIKQQKDKDDLIIKQQKDKESNLLYKFLMENTRYSEGKIILMSEIKEEYNNWIGKKVYKLDNGTFSQVNNEYIIEKKNMCKTCNKEANKNCCKEYNSKNRSVKIVVKNLEFI